MSIPDARVLMTHVVDAQTDRLPPRYQNSHLPDLICRGEQYGKGWICDEAHPSLIRASLENAAISLQSPICSSLAHRSCRWKGLAVQAASSLQFRRRHTDR